jgi:predicted permease
VDTYLDYIGGICTPMTMVFIGSTLCGTNILHVIKDKVILESVINKIFIIPIIAYTILIFLPVSAMTKAMLFFAACFPTAAITTVIVETEGKNSVMACGVMAVGTAISIVTLPLAINLINLSIL